jgi:hypothetical protein
MHPLNKPKTAQRQKVVRGRESILPLYFKGGTVAKKDLLPEMSVDKSDKTLGSRNSEILSIWFMTFNLGNLKEHRGKSRSVTHPGHIPDYSGAQSDATGVA